MTTRDGRQTALAERYQEFADVTGIVLEQTVTGLPTGVYKAVLYANANYTPDRGFDSDISDGQMDVVYIFANDSQQYIPVHIGTEIAVHGEYEIVADVPDGTLRLGMMCEKAGTNWHTIQIKSLDRIGDITPPVESDLTALVGVSAEEWNTTGMISAEFAPVVTTRDGRTTALAERYNVPADVTGVVLEQTVTGLQNGAYRTELYANACYTPGRGFDSDIYDGQMDVVYLSANDNRQYIPVHVGTNISQHGEYTLTCDVTNGQLVLTMVCEKVGTNWHSIQIKSLDRIGEVGAGIETIGNSQLIMDNVVYDLQGRKIKNNAKKGLYIINGKKVVVK